MYQKVWAEGVPKCLPPNDGMEWYEEQMHEYQSTRKNSLTSATKSPGNSAAKDKNLKDLNGDDLSPGGGQPLDQKKQEQLLEEESKARWVAF